MSDFSQYFLVSSSVQTYINLVICETMKTQSLKMIDFGIFYIRKGEFTHVCVVKLRLSYITKKYDATFRSI